MQPHEAVLRSYLRGAFPAVRDVDDVVQESYVRIWKARAVHPIISAKAFLFQVARRLAIDALRRTKAEPIDQARDLATLDVLLDEPDALSRITHHELKHQLIEAIASLPNRYREIVIMRRFEELPQKVVAQKLGISERTVENLLARGLKKLEQALSEQGPLDRYRT